MNETFKKAANKIKNPKFLLIAGLAGILLIALSSFTGNKEKAAKKQASSGISAEEYKAELESGVREIVKGITGDKSATVVVTLESGIKYSYADTNEGSSADKTESNSKSTSSYITVKTADGGEQALLVTAEMPEVRGVAVVCRGGDDELINEKIKNAVTAALNITSKRVYIAGGTDNEKR